MHFKPILLLSSLLALSACQTQMLMPWQQDPSATAQTLTQYQWSYTAPNATRPLVLNFNPQRVNIITGCNRQTGTWQILQHQLTISPLMATKMACEPERMQLEFFSSHLFSGNTLHYHIVQHRQNTPILLLQHKNGQRYRFMGIPKNDQNSDR